jgi:NitT/TauT family transport system substrate-binding protein
MAAKKLWLVALVLLFAQSAAAEPLRIRMSFIQPVSNWATMLLQTPGLAKHLGQSYTFEAIHFQGTPLLVQALAANEIEIGNFSYGAFPIAVGNAGLQDLRIIADEIQDGVPGYFSDQYVVLKDSPIKTVDDLRGRVLGTNVIGSGTDIPMRAMLLKHGLKDKDGVTIIEMPTSASLPALLEKKIELRVATMPDFSDPRLRANTRTLFTQADAMGVSQLGMWVARAAVIEKNRAALVDFLEDALQQERWYYDPANRQGAIEIASKVAKTPPERFEGWVFKKNGADGDYYRDLNGRPNLDAVQSNMDEMQKLGFLKTRIEVGKYVDLSLVEDAVKRLP